MFGDMDNVHDSSGGFLNNSRAGTSDNKKDKRSSNIVPVMIRHLVNSFNDLTLWGEPIHLITIVGVIRDIENTATKTTYEIEDETGKINAFRWLEAGKSASDSILEVNTYVRTFGCIREQGGKRHVLILKMYPITNFNEITNHLLEVTYVMLQTKKWVNMDSRGRTTNISCSNDVDMPDDRLMGLSKEQTLIFKIIQEANDSENGIERKVLEARVPKSILSQMDEIIDFLTSEGHIYTTVTDDHFKAT